MTVFKLFRKSSFPRGLLWKWRKVVKEQWVGASWEIEVSRLVVGSMYNVIYAVYNTKQLNKYLVCNKLLKIRELFIINIP